MARRNGCGFGIVGCGMIADFHANAIKAMKGGRLVACLDTLSEKAARRVGAAFGCAWYTDERRFLAHPGLDVVTIATPSGSHLEPALAAAKAGKHVVCEKPLEITLERCDRMIAACRKAGVTLAGLFPARAAEASQILKRTVDSGRFGRLTLCDAYVKWWRSQEYYDSGGWRGTWKLDGGGALMNQSIHTIDMLQWLAGPVESVFAVTDRLAHKRIEVEDVAVAALRFRSRALGVIEGSSAAYPGHPKEIHISGEKGSAFLRDSSFTVWRFAEEKPEDEKILRKHGLREAKAGAGAADPRTITWDGHRVQFEDAERAIRTGKEPMVSGPEARKAVEIILAIYKSAQTGSVVRLPLKSTPRFGDPHVAARRLRRGR
jgi:predicted dehydrogenase